MEHGVGESGIYGLKNLGDTGDEGVEDVGEDIVEDGDSGKTIPSISRPGKFLLVK